MRSLQELIDEVRHNTNNVEGSRHTDIDLLRYFNTAQRQVQRLIFNSNPTTPVFVKESVFTFQSGIKQYSLPQDLYAMGAIIAVFPIRTGGIESEAIQRITEREQITKAGYYVKGKNIYLSAGSVGESVTQVRISYVKRLPSFTSVNDIPELPEETEDFLTSFVERKINYVDSSQDIINSNVFTTEEKQELIELFADTSSDIKYPVVSDETYITY